MSGADDEALALEATTPAAAVDATTPDHRTVHSGGAGAAPPPHAAGTKIGRYTIAGVLGSGGMGVVYRAFDPQLGRPVALKVVRPGHGSDETRERLIREAQAMAKLAHPNVIAVHDAGAVDDEVFVAMELVEGENLAVWLETRRSWRESLAMFEQAARGLAAAHAAGLVHRDFKPLNVLVGKDGRARVLDFGLARPIATVEPASDAAQLDTASPSLTRTGAVVGTPLYMAPEQHAGGATDARTDQFAFCVALYHALYGAYPFTGSTLPELMVSVMEGKVSVPSGARGPLWLRRIVLRGLSVRPDARFPSMEALLERIAIGLRRRRRVYIAAVALSVLAIAASVTAVVSRRDDATPKLPAFASARPQQITFAGGALAPALSHDGKRVAFASSARGGHDDLVVQDLDAGTGRSVFQTHMISKIRWSPDDTRLLVDAGSAAYIVPLAAEPAIRIGRCDSMSGWSPDGRRLLRLCKPSHWEVVDTSTGTSETFEREVPRSLFISDLDWGSNDQILIRSMEEDRATLWTMRPDGADLRELEHGSRLALREPCWSSKGDRIFYANADGLTGELAIDEVSQAGAVHSVGAINLGAAIAFGQFSIAADERTLVTAQGSTSYDIVALEGARSRDLIHDTLVKSGLRVSNDRARIAFAAGTTTTMAIHIIDSTGAPVLSLPAAPGRITDLAWSPDGQDIAYIAVFGDANQLWRANLGTKKAAKLSDEAIGWDLDWSPRGTLLVARTDGHDLSIIDPTTGSARPWLDAPRRRDDLTIGSPRFSPDGTRVVLRVTSRDRIGLTLYAADGTLVDDNFYTEATSPIGWSADGAIAYAMSVGGVVGIGALHRTSVVLGMDTEVGEAAPSAAGWILVKHRSTSDLWAMTTRLEPLALATAVHPFEDSAPAPTPAFVNPGLTGDPGGPPAGWALERALGCRVTREPTGVLIVSMDRCALTQRVDASEFRGRRVRFRASVREATGRASVIVISIVDGSQVISGGHALERGARAMEALVDIRPDAEAVEFQIRINTGQLKVDGASVELDRATVP